MRGFANDSPVQFEVEGSPDGTSWKRLVQGKGTPGMTTVSFATPANVRFLRIRQEGRKPGKYWSIHELTLLAPGRVEIDGGNEGGRRKRQPGSREFQVREPVPPKPWDLIPPPRRGRGGDMPGQAVPNSTRNFELP